LKADVISALRRIDELKSREWRRQLQSQAPPVGDTHGAHNAIHVDSSKFAFIIYSFIC
jgi:hypothetical protein